MEKKTIAKISLEAQEVLKRLEQCEVGEIVPYPELSSLAMGDIQKEKYFALSTARNNLLGVMAFGTVRNQGIKRLSDDEIVDSIGDALPRIRKMTARRMRTLVTVDYDQLDKQGKVKHNAALAMYGALNFMTKPKHMDKVLSKAQDMDGAIPLSDTISMFQK